MSKKKKEIQKKNTKNTNKKKYKMSEKARQKNCGMLGNVRNIMDFSAICTFTVVWQSGFREVLMIFA